MGIEDALAFEELKGVLHVKEREKDTFKQISEETKAKNREHLYHLRCRNQDLHRAAVLARSGGKHIVERIFCNRPREKPLMNDKTLMKAAVLMDDKLFEINRYLGLLNYQQNKLKDILFKKQETLTFFKNLLASDLEGRAKYDYLKLQTETELVKMKRMDAWNTSNIHRKIIATLKQDIFEMNTKIKVMEQTRRDKAKVLEEIIAIKNGVVEQFKRVQNQLNPLANKIETKTQEYETDMRKKNKEHMDQMRDTLIKCNTDRKAIVYEEESPDKIRNREIHLNTELKNYQDVFEIVMDALEISDVQDVIKRVQSEHARYSQLCQQLEESNAHQDKLRWDILQLKEELDSLKYDNKVTGCLPKDLEKLERQADEYALKLQDLNAKLKEKEKTIAGIKLATVAIHSKLLFVKLPADEPSTLIGEPANDMTVIWLKTERLIHAYGGTKMEGSIHDNKELQNYIEMRLPEDNLRTVLRPLDFVPRDNLRYEFEDIQPGYVSREDIKKRSYELRNPKKMAKGNSGGEGGRSGRKR